MEAELIDHLCQRWGCPPSVVRAENAHDVLSMLAILATAYPVQGGE